MDFLMFLASHDTDEPIRVVIDKDAPSREGARVYTVGGNTLDGFSYTYHTYTFLGKKVRYEINIRSMIGERKIEYYCQKECSVNELMAVETAKGRFPRWSKIGEKEAPLAPQKMACL